MATHSSILARRVSWTEEPSGLVHRIAKSWTELEILNIDIHTGIDTDLIP